MPDVNLDFSQPLARAPEQHEWVESPQPEVERVLLDRWGDEKAVATSVVRYARDSHFPEHDHPGGEEFVVLEGEFIDEHGRYPQGTYVRNPPGSSHAPWSDSGCILFVKLCQFHPEDTERVVLDARLPMPARGVERRELHRYRGEVVTALAAAGGAMLSLPPAELVQELFVLEGHVEWQHRNIGAGGWIRVPAAQDLVVRALEDSRLVHKTRPRFALPDPA